MSVNIQGHEPKPRVYMDHAEMGCTCGWDAINRSGGRLGLSPLDTARFKTLTEARAAWDEHLGTILKSVDAAGGLE